MNTYAHMNDDDRYAAMAAARRDREIRDELRRLGSAQIRADRKAGTR